MDIVGVAIIICVFAWPLKEEEGNVKACVDEASTAVCVFNSLHK